MPLQIGKTPIVVPRQHQYNEHVNDHQVEFARNVAQRMGTIIPVEDINTLGDVITNYDQIVAGIFWTGLPNIELEKELPLSVPWYLPGSGKCKISDF